METAEEVVKELLAENLSTVDFYFDVYEELSAEREELHQEIIHTLLTGQSYSRGKRVYMLGGAPANGKSTFLKSDVMVYPKTALKIDPDEIKTMLPEYQYMIANREPLAAALVHEESSFLSKEVRRIAIAEGYDIILDGVANDVLKKRLEDLEELRINGHTVRIDYVTLDTALSLRLAELRFQITSRKVPETYILEKNRMIAELVPQLIENKSFDELFLWDTNIENHPRLVLSQVNGKLAVENWALYENIKKKANVEV